MEILKTRPIQTRFSSIGPITIDGVFECYGLEPTDRNLCCLTPLHTIELIKKPGMTAIPTGRYRCTKFWSNKHHCFVVRVMDVPGFDYIEIHIGNFPKDTIGCTVVGTGFGGDMVSNSAVALKAFNEKVFAAFDRGEEVWITYDNKRTIIVK